MKLNADDRLSDDGFYLTSQILRIIQEPPPAGSPEKTPARSFAKAWDRVHVNKGETMAIEADVTTYDSGTDLLWAYGEGERGVTFAQQAAPGQPLSANYGKAFQYNVKSHAGRFVRSDSLNFVDHKTGARPSNVAMPDPTAPPKKKGKKPFFVPNTNLEAPRLHGLLTLANPIGFLAEMRRFAERIREDNRGRGALASFAAEIANCSATGTTNDGSPEVPNPDPRTLRRSALRCNSA